MLFTALIWPNELLVSTVTSAVMSNQVSIVSLVGLFTWKTWVPPEAGAAWAGVLSASSPPDSVVMMAAASRTTRRSVLERTAERLVVVTTVPPKACRESGRAGRRRPAIRSSSDGNLLPLSRADVAATPVLLARVNRDDLHRCGFSSARRKGQRA